MAGKSINVGLSTFADDTRKLIVCEERKALAEKEKVFSDILDSELTMVNFAQNGR